MRSRREVFVEILYNPEKRRSLKRTCPERRHAILPPVSPTLSESYNPTLHKKRRLSLTLSEEDHSNDPSRPPSPISPTASETGFIASGSRSTPPETRSPTLSEGVIELDKESFPDEGTFQATDPFIYDQTEDDVDETDDLVIPGESQVDDEDEDEDIPVRVLDDFVIYAAGTFEVVSTAELLQLEYSHQKYLASGLVRPWTDPADDADIEESEDSDDDERDSQKRGIPSDEDRDRVSLSIILELSLHASSDGEYPIDPKLYIRTKYAWYILGVPAEKYRLLYIPLWRCQRLLHLLVVASINNSRVTYPQFVAALPQLDESEDAIANSINIMGRALKEADLKLDDVSSYIVSNLPDICFERGIRISRVPLIRDIMGPMHYEFDVDMRPEKKRNAARKVKSIATSPKSGFQNQVKTFLTPTVNRIARDFFEGSLEVAQSQRDETWEEQDRDTLHHKGHYSNPTSITFRKRFSKYEGCYQSAVIDGVTYNMGDVVMVAPDKMDSSKVYSVNKYANKWWFCQIRYFFEKESTTGKLKMFHGLWFNHGSKTLLQETSHTKALYLLGSCDDNFVTAIIKKCNFRILRPGDEEVLDDTDPQSNDFHCGLYCKDDDTAFVDLPDNALNVEEDERSCFACRLEQEKEKAMEVHLGLGSLMLHGMEYHVYDFIYFIPSHQTKLLGIAQVIKITQSNVIVCMLGRYDEFIAHAKSSSKMDNNLIFDERRLYLTDEYLTLPFHKLDGMCYVQHLMDARRIESWVEGNDHFYLNQKLDNGQLHNVSMDKLACCEPCIRQEHEARKRLRTYMRTNSKLVGLELFSGAGGLGVGMNLSGYVETKYAVEYSPSAAKTYAPYASKNHPDTTVYCQDTNTLLKHALMTEKGSKVKLMSLDGKTHCPPLPDKSSAIDFIFGGPPCQSFSLANHSKRRDDIRSTMPCNMLSYVEHYEPSYFLLENVVGFLSHKFYANRETEGGTVETEIQAGMVKFVLRTLIALGYQVRFKVLQAAQYGVPQCRRRVIFWGAKRGVPLPDFPAPVYAYEKGMHKVHLPTGTLDPPSRSRDPDNPHQYAPLAKITVNAAISDLPKFDWLNPHRVHARTGWDRKTAVGRREELGIACFAAAVGDGGQTDWSALPGFPDGAAYCAVPQNRFQRWLRRDMDEGEHVTGQYTMRFPARVVEATCTVPLTPGAHHRDLPADLLPAFIHKAKKSKRVIYGRMDGEGLFRCAMTQLSPVLKNQWPLHPSQKRIITVREAARCQGFPDDYEFESTNSKPSKIIEDQLRQIGNAVAVPFALALGRELGKVLVGVWEKKEREGSVVV